MHQSGEYIRKAKTKFPETTKTNTVGIVLYVDPGFDFYMCTCMCGGIIHESRKGTLRGEQML